MSTTGKANDIFVFESIIAFSYKTLVDARMDPSDSLVKENLSKLLFLLESLENGSIQEANECISGEWIDWFRMLTKNKKYTTGQLEKFISVSFFIRYICHFAMKFSQCGELKKAQVCFNSIHALPFAIISDQWSGQDYWETFVKDLDFIENLLEYKIAFT